MKHLLLTLPLALAASAATAQQPETNTEKTGTSSQDASAQTAGKGIAVGLADSLILSPYSRMQSTNPSDICAQLAIAAGATRGWCAQIPVTVSNQSDKQDAIVFIEALAAQVGPSLRFAVGHENAAAFLDGMTIKPNSTLRLPLTAFATEAGEHTAKIRVKTSDGNTDHHRVLAVSAKRNWGWMLGMLGIGGFAGLLLASLRETTGDRATAIAKSLTVAERYRTIAALARSTRLIPPEHDLLLDNEIKSQLANARAGRPLDETLDAKLDALKEWTRLALYATALQANLLEPLTPQFHAELSRVLNSGGALDLPSLEGKVKAALTAQASKPGFEAAVAKSAVPASDIAVSIAPINLAPILFDVSDLRQFDRRRFFIEFVIAVVSFLLFAIAAVIVLYVKDAGWGTLEDLLSAVLVGAVAFLGAGAVSRIREAARV